MKRLIVLMIVASLMFFTGSTNLCADTPTAQTKEVTVGVIRVMSATALIIAIEKGYFTDAGLSVKVKEYPIGKVAMEAMLKGEVSLAVVGDLPIVLNSFNRSDFAVIAICSSSYNHSKLISRKDRGITQPSDLKGKTIGLPFGTTTHYFLDTLLSYNMILPTDLKMQNIPAIELPAALADGKVDAIAGFEPYAYQAAKLTGENAFIFPKTGLYRETLSLVAMKEFLNRDPEAANKILQAVDRATAFIRNNKKEAMAIISRKLGMEQQFLIDRWDDYAFNLILDQSFLMTLEDEARWAIRSKMTEKKESPNYLRYIYQDALRAVKPEAMGIFSK